MHDFQEMLRMVMESDTPLFDKGVDASPAVSLEEAKSPTEAFKAFRQEQIQLWQKMQQEVSQEIAKLDNLQTHFGSMISDLGTQKDLKTHLAAQYTPIQRPDRSRLDAARAAWQAQNKQQPTPGN